jgi:hypothetical protein
MRHLLLVGLVLAVVNLHAAQVNGPTISITIASAPNFDGSGTVVVSHNGFYLGGPLAGVGAQIATGAGKDGLSFWIRAWREDGKARVVVYALLDDRRAPTGKTETPISTFTISPGQTVDVRDTEKWGASKVLVTATVSDR